MANAPAFQFYTRDFLDGTAHLLPEEVGIYMRLLIHQWSKGSVTTDMRRLRQITGGDDESIQTVLDEFFEDTGDGCRKNKRLEQVRLEQAEYREEMSKRGKRGAEARWGKNGEGYGTSNSTSNASANGTSYGTPSSSPSSPPKEIEFEIDRGDFANCERKYLALVQALRPSSAGDKLLLWRAAVLCVVAYSEHWLHDAINALEACKPRKKFAYLTRCFREGAKSLDRDFNEDAKRVPPLPKRVAKPATALKVVEGVA